MFSLFPVPLTTGITGQTSCRDRKWSLYSVKECVDRSACVRAPVIWKKLGFGLCFLFLILSLWIFYEEHWKWYSCILSGHLHPWKPGMLRTVFQIKLQTQCHRKISSDLDTKFCLGGAQYFRSSSTWAVWASFLLSVVSGVIQAIAWVDPLLGPDGGHCHIDLQNVVTPHNVQRIAPASGWSSTRASPFLASRTLRTLLIFTLCQLLLTTVWETHPKTSHTALTVAGSYQLRGPEGQDRLIFWSFH